MLNQLDFSPFNRLVMLGLGIITIVILGLSAAGLMTYPDTLTQFSSHCLTFCWSLAVFGGWLYAAFYAKHKSWLGVITFVLLWSVFPLLKLIKHRFIAWQADGALTAIDGVLWGGYPLPAYFDYENHAIISEILAGCYFGFYFLVVGAVIFYAKNRHTPASVAFFGGLVAVYVIGLVGYFLLPAAGPAFYQMPDKGASGVVAKTVINIVKQGVTGMDAFPSLHTAVSLYVVGFLWCDGRKKTAMALLPLAVVIVLATVGLRYHYGIDVLVGIVLAVWAVYQFAKQKQLVSSH